MCRANYNMLSYYMPSEQIIKFFLGGLFGDHNAPDFRITPKIGSVVFVLAEHNRACSGL